MGTRLLGRAIHLSRRGKLYAKAELCRPPSDPYDLVLPGCVGRNPTHNLYLNNDMIEGVGSLRFDRAKQGTAMKTAALFLILFLATNSLTAAAVVSDEDRTRFTERLYDRTQPGLKSPQEYVALAKKMVSAKYPSVAFVDFDDGVVTYRTYRNAPKADHEMICVNFAYRSSSGGGHGFIGGVGGLFLMGGDTQRAVLLVLMRRDLSKVYIRLVHLKAS